MGRSLGKTRFGVADRTECEPFAQPELALLKVYPP